MTERKRPTLSLLQRLVPAMLIFLTLSLATACGGDDAGDGVVTDPPTTSASATASPAPGTPAPANASLARQVFADFVQAVLDGDLEAAWSMYIASVPDDVTQYNETLGCSRGAFGGEFPKMQHMFDRIAPLTVDEVFGGASASLVIELQLSGEDGNSYLATLLREPSDADYRLRFFNSGRVAAQPGVPDPFPSPEDPQGFCGIWTGPR